MGRQKSYFAIHTNEDGEATFYRFDGKDALLEWLKEDHLTESISDSEIVAGKTYELNSAAGLILIKGVVIEPVPVEVVQKWDIE